MTNEELIEKAAAVVRPKQIGEYTVGNVGSALLSEQGHVYLGVCIDVGSSMGFCAEHAAIGAMVTAGEYRIRKVVAVCDVDGALYVLAPCGRCREFMRQIDPANLEAEVVLAPDRAVRLKELLPEHEWFYRLQP